MGKSKNNNAWSTLKRLFNLTSYLTEKSSVGGASWDEIKENIYAGESDASDEALYRKFSRDRQALKDIYDDGMDGEDFEFEDDEPLDGQAFIIRNKNGKYILRSGVSFMFLLKLNEEQALTLLSSVRIIPEFIPLFTKASKQLWDKLQNHISKELQEKCRSLSEAIVSNIPFSKAGERQVILTVLEAISKKKVLQVLQYEKAWPDDPGSCNFSPWTLFLKYHSWYVLGEVNNKTRFLRVDRIKRAAVLELDQPHPCDDEKLKVIQEDIKLDRYSHTAYPMPKDGWHIRLRITGSFVKPCRETEWFPHESKTLQPDGSLDYQVNLKGLEAITLWIMRALNCIEVLEPAELQEIIDQRVDEYIARRKIKN